MTLQEAKDKAIAAGIPEGDVTAADLRLYGFEVGDPTHQFTPQPPLTEAQVKDDLGLALAEAQGNATLTNVLKRVGPLLLKAASMALLFVLCLTGCSNTKAKALTTQSDISVKMLNDGHLAFEEGFIQDFRVKEFARIDAVYDEAVKSHTISMPRQVTTQVKVKTIAADGKVTESTEPQASITFEDFIKPTIAQALLKQKLDLYSQVEQNTIAWRVKQATISKNASNALVYSEGLRAYFDQRAVDLEALNKQSTQWMEFLEKFLASRGLVPTSPTK